MSTVTIQAVRESVAVARSHGEKFFEQIVWQVENEAWMVLGYGSWDAMRAGEYGDMGVVAPSADRPELATRLRAKGLTQQAIADTLGVSQRQISTDLNSRTSNEDSPETITNSRGQERPASYTRAPRPDAPEYGDYPADPENGEPPTGDFTGIPTVTHDASRTKEETPVPPATKERPSVTKYGPKRKHLDMLNALLNTLSGANVALDDIDELDASITRNEAIRIRDDLAKQIQSLSRIKRLLEGIGNA